MKNLNELFFFFLKLFGAIRKHNKIAVIVCAHTQQSHQTNANNEQKREQAETYLVMT